MIRTVYAILAAGVFLAGCATGAGTQGGGPADTSRQLVRETVLEAGGEPYEIREFSYSPTGELVEERLFDASGQVREISSSVYNEGRRTERRSYAASGELLGRRTYTYTAKGLLESESFFDGEGRFLFVSRFSYNYWGDTIEWITTDAEGRLMAATHSTYERGRARTITLSGAHGNETIVQVGYDRDGRKVRETHDGGEENQGKEILFYYDERGRLAYEEVVSGFGNLLGRTVYVYTADNRQPDTIRLYDGRGNPRRTLIHEFALRPESGSSL